ncbi:MAG: DNA-binding protein [Anaerolineae bacterium]|jgi:predicted DNA-binding protein with PD1-like motif
MQIRKIGSAFVMRLEAGDEVIASLQTWAAEEQIGFASVQAIGALRQATLGYFDPGANSYQHISVVEQVEMLSLKGNISREEGGGHKVHVHAVLGRSDGSTLGGHLEEGVVFPTLEVVLTPLPGEVVRRQDPLSGLALWDLSD